MSTAMPFSVVTGTVALPVGDGEMSAYVARPEAPGRRRAVIVGFEMFGTTAYIRRTAERLAGLGLVAIVPDFHHRTAPGYAGVADEQGRAEGLALLGRLDREEVHADLLAVLAHLRQREDASGWTGMVGFSLGGHLAYFAAARVPLAAVAVVYPGWLDTAGTALSATEPLLALTPEIALHGTRLLYLVGADDHVATPGQTRRVAEALRSAAVPHEIVVYPATPHGFLADERTTFRPAESEDAWRRLTHFLLDQ